MLNGGRIKLTFILSRKIRMGFCWKLYCLEGFWWGGLCLERSCKFQSGGDQFIAHSDNAVAVHISRVLAPSVSVYLNLYTYVTCLVLAWRIPENVFYRSKQLERGLWDRNSVCPSVTHVLCDETIELATNILIPHERVISLVFWYQQKLMGDIPFPLKFALKNRPTLFEKRRLRPISAHCS